METEQLEHELESHKKMCELSGCLDLVVLKTDFEKEKGEIMKCIDRIKGTMQVKSHILWEIVKIVAIPAATILGIYYTSFVKLEADVKILKALISKSTGIQIP